MLTQGWVVAWGWCAADWGSAHTPHAARLRVSHRQRSHAGATAWRSQACECCTRGSAPAADTWRAPLTLSNLKVRARDLPPTFWYRVTSLSASLHWITWARSCSSAAVGGLRAGAWERAHMGRVHRWKGAVPCTGREGGGAHICGAAQARQGGMPRLYGAAAWKGVDRAWGGPCWRAGALHRRGTVAAATRTCSAAAR